MSEHQKKQYKRVEESRQTKATFVGPLPPLPFAKFPRFLFLVPDSPCSIDMQHCSLNREHAHRHALSPLGLPKARLTAI